MKPSIYLGRIFGIEIKLHYSWFIIFLLVTSTLTLDFSKNLGWPFWICVLTGSFAAFLLFVSILFHEIAHSFIGKRNKVPIRSISLFLFGGVAQISKDPSSPYAEFKMAIAGPIFSTLFAFLFLFLSRLSLGDFFPIVFQYLFLMNLILVFFNLIPAFPSDGGRIFRSILWASLNNLKTSTKIAVLVSQVIAFLIILLGFFQIIQQNLFGGIWLIFIGWFLIQAAEMSFQQVVIKESLAKIQISEIMDREFSNTHATKTLQEVKEDFFKYQQGGFPVVDEGKILGIITIEDLKKVPKDDWDKKRVSDAMTPSSRLITISPADSAFDALSKMFKYDIGRLPVVHEGKILGLLTRASLFFILTLVEEGKHDAD